MGSQALQANQTVITTIGNNLANVNTPGYADERANLTESWTIQSGGNSVGTGVSVVDIQAIRSPILDSMVQGALGEQGYADQNANMSSSVQSALGEQLSSSSGSSATGNANNTTSPGPIQTALTNFFGAFQTLASTPNDSTARQLTVQSATELADSLNGAYSRLQQTQANIGTDASNITDQINQLSTNIAGLNKQILLSQSASGQAPNDMVSSRESYIEQLSSLVNVSATSQSNGTVTIALADNPGVVLVNGEYSGGASGTQTLSASFNAANAVPLTVSGSTSGALASGLPSGGSLGADLQVANNMIGSPGSVGNTGMLGAMDNVASQLITQVNAQSAAGFDLNGNPGGAIFSGADASSISVNPALVSNPSLLAAGNGSGPLDGSNASAMANLQSNPAIIPAFQQMVTNTGATVNAATDNQTTQDQVTKQLQSQQNSYEGVSIDQEMTNLVNYQQSYAASARFITTVDNMFSTLIAEIPN